jgi:hypothetical protein
MPGGAQKRRRKSSLRFCSRKELKRSRMRLRSGSSQEPAQEDTARVLNYGNIVSQRELESIQETVYETPIQSKQPENCEEGSDSDEESHDVEVIFVLRM